MMTTIDYHSHFVPPDCLEFEVAGPGGSILGSYTNPETGEMRVNGRLRRLGAAGDQPWGATDANPLWTLETRLAYMDDAGVDVQVLSVPPYMCVNDGDPGDAWKLSRRANLGMRSAVDGSNRFIGFATVPLQDPPMAARELEYAVETLGLGGVQILTNVGGRGLDDPRLTVFWRAVSDLDVPIFLHPANTTDPHQRGYYLNNLIGNPTETAIAAAHIIFGGIIDRFPDLRFVLAHAGGTIPALLGRWRHGAEVIPELAILPRGVDDYLPSFAFDTVSHAPAMLEFMKHVLELRIVVGTDYPFDMGDLAPLATLDAAAGLSEAERGEIASANLFTRSSAKAMEKADTV